MDVTRILIIEDEKTTAHLLEQALTGVGYQADVAYTGQEGYEKFKEGVYALVLLDLVLPDVDGLEILSRMRDISEMPVIIITGKSHVTDKVTGLDSGADDYLVKPFDIAELLARIRVSLKKNTALRANDDKGVIHFDPLTVDTRQRLVKSKDAVISLTKTEYDLLIYLIDHRNEVLSRKKILDVVWGIHYEGHTNVVDVYIRYLRAKIDERLNIKFIHTIRGVGYYVKGPE